MQGMCKKAVFMGACSLLLCACTGPAVARAQAPDQAELEKGRQVVTQACAACHTTITRMIQIHKQTPAEWKDTVYFMISRGAQIKPEEIDAVTAYLVEAGGKGAGQAGEGAGGGRGGAGRGGALTADADGRTIFQRTCQQCHELTVASNKKPTEEWSAVLVRMTSYGANLNSAEREKLMGYLQTLGK
jgi:cytochrome c5